MKNLRIANKLLMSFGGAGLLLVALIVFAISQMGSMNALTEDAVNDRMPKLMMAEDMQNAAANFRVAEGIHILMTDDAGLNAAEATMRSWGDKVESDYRTLDAKLRKPQARLMIARFRDGWTRYLAQNARVRTLSRAQQNGPATALMVGASRDAYEQLNKAAADLVEFEAQVAKTGGADALAVYSRARMLCFVAVALALAAMGAILVLLVRQIAKPVSAVTVALTELAKGRMDATVPDSDRRDEVGELATAMTGLRDQLAAAERAKAEQTALIVGSVGDALSKLAGGDLVARVEADLTGPFAKLKSDFNAAAAALQTTMAQVAQAATGINGGAGEIRQASDDLSHRTEQQAASLEETAAAMDEITATVRRTAERATQANDAVKSARAEAEHSGEVVRDAVAAMGGIERTSNEISEIISVIDGIAFQTNLLALNAGVEAARAGDAGKGFAVVASEVRALAQRSAEAAKDVKARITASAHQVDAGVKLVGETGEALARIVARIQEINGLVSEIAASAEQQATGLHQVNTAVTEMDGVTQQNAAMVEEATAAARSLASEADGLASQIARFRTGDAGTGAPSPVHQLRERAAAGVRQVRSAPRRAAAGGGSAAVAMAEDDWSEF